jgi:hypothetical protein
MLRHIALFLFWTATKRTISLAEMLCGSPWYCYSEASDCHCCSTSSYDSDREASGRSRRHKKSSRSRKVSTPAIRAFLLPCFIFCQMAPHAYLGYHLLSYVIVKGEGTKQG